MKNIRIDKKVVAKLKRHRRAVQKMDVELAWQKPLRVMSHKQRESYCGPACIRIVAAYFGRNHSEEEIGKLCGTTLEDGTDAHGLIEGAEKLGAMVFATHNGDIADLRYFLHEQHLPVIVAWYSPSRPRFRKFKPGVDYPWGHYSVVYHVSRTHVYLMDPDDGKRYRYTISRFKHLWWNNDSARQIGIRHWFMVMQFEKGWNTAARRKAAQRKTRS